MKFAGYVAYVLLCKHCKFGGKIYYVSRDIEFFLRDYYFWRALYMYNVHMLHVFPAPFVKPILIIHFYFHFSHIFQIFSYFYSQFYSLSLTPVFCSILRTYLFHKCFTIDCFGTHRTDFTDFEP